jgi:serine/threonine protein kinase
MASLIGERLGQYRITDLLGEGSTATVYRARRDTGSGDVAIKVIKPNLIEEGEFFVRFKREAQVAAALDHPHILKVLDYGQRGEIVYMVMQWVTGGSLADLMERQQLSLALIGDFIVQIASALDYAHQRGIVHRDLKPHNVLVANPDTLYLCDFGMVKSLGMQTLTKAGTVLGTPAYISPEQCMTSKIDARSDIYSLGVVLFEMLTGQLPFFSRMPLGMMSMHCYKQPPLVSAVKPGLPVGIDEIVNKALAKKPAERYATAGEMAAAFKACVSSRTASRPRQTAPSAPAGMVGKLKPTNGRTDGPDKTDRTQAPKSRQMAGAAMPALPARSQIQTVMLLATLLGLVALIAVFVVVLLSATG